MELSTYFDEFLKKHVNLNKDRQKTIRASVQAVNSCVQSAEDLNGKLTGVCRSQGSWEHGTIVKPIDNKGFDVDIQIEFEEQDDWEPKDYLRNLRLALKASPTYAEKLERKDRCVRVLYHSNDGEFHVDIIPIIERAGHRYPAIVNFRENAFETTDPEAFTKWVADRNRWSGGQLAKTLRLMKWLRNQVTSSPKSVILTILMADLVRQSDKGSSDFRNTSVGFVTLLERLNNLCATQIGNPHIPDPSCPIVNFDHRWESDDEFAKFKTRVARWAEIARRATDESDKEKSIAAWQELFGTNFVSPVATARTSAAQLSTRAGSFGDRPAVPPVRTIETVGLRDQTPYAPREQFAEERFDAVDIIHQVEISARTSEFVQNRWFRRKHKLRSRIGHQLRFEISECTVPEPFDVYWKTRNVGPKTPKGQERGQIDRVPGGIRKESSSFVGEHFVECYLVKRGTCVAWAHFEVPIDDDGAPLVD